MIEWRYQKYSSGLKSDLTNTIALTVSDNLQISVE